MYRLLVLCIKASLDIILKGGRQILLTVRAFPGGRTVVLIVTLLHPSCGIDGFYKLSKRCARTAYNGFTENIPSCESVKHRGVENGRKLSVAFCIGRIGHVIETLQSINIMFLCFSTLGEYFLRKALFLHLPGLGSFECRSDFGSLVPALGLKSSKRLVESFLLFLSIIRSRSECIGCGFLFGVLFFDLSLYFNIDLVHGENAGKVMVACKVRCNVFLVINMDCIVRYRSPGPPGHAAVHLYCSANGGLTAAVVAEEEVDQCRHNGYTAVFIGGVIWSKPNNLGRYFFSH